MKKKHMLKVVKQARAAVTKPDSLSSPDFGKYVRRMGNISYEHVATVNMIKRLDSPENEQ